MQPAFMIRDRAAYSLAAATSIASVFVWHERTLLQMGDSVTLLDQLDAEESARRTAWRNAAIFWDNTLAEIKAVTATIKRQGSFRFGGDAVKKGFFARLKIDGRSREDIYQQGKQARDAWQEVDAAWKLSGDYLLSAFSSLLASSIALDNAHGPKFTAWRKTASTLNNKARTINRDNVAWYAEATRKFKKGTAEGDMIRSTVPTTTRPAQPVGLAAISNVMVAGTAVHFDFTALHATRFTVFHKAPGSPVFLVVVTETKERSFTFHDLAPGEHEFTVAGVNAKGEGPQSVVVKVTVAAAAAA